MPRPFAEVPHAIGIARAIERLPLPRNIAERRRLFWRRVGLAAWALVIAAVVSPLLFGGR